MATTVSTLLAGLHRDPGRPRLTWYGPQGERIELSGAVLDNWVAKTVNLMVEEFDTGPGSVVSIALPPHWRTVVWALAAWRCGASIDDEDADVLVTDRPQDAGSTSAEVVAVALPALALRWPGPALAAGVIDAAQAVMTYGDQIGWAPDPAAADPALPGLSHGDLATAALAAADLPTSARVLLPVTAGTDPRRFLLTALGVLLRDGSLVLVTADHEPGQVERIVATERIGHRLSPAE